VPAQLTLSNSLGSPSGTYTITFMGDTTAPIPYDADATDVFDAMWLLPSIISAGSFAVDQLGLEGDEVSDMLLYFSAGGFAGEDIDDEDWTFDSSGLVNLDARFDTHLEGGVLDSKFRQLTITDLGGISGTFTLTFRGQTTSAIAFDSSGPDMQAALVALSNIDPGDVVVTGDVSDAVIEFQGAFSSQKVLTTDLELNSAGLSNASASLSVIPDPTSEYRRIRINLDPDQGSPDRLARQRSLIENDELLSFNGWIPWNDTIEVIGDGSIRCTQAAGANQDFGAWTNIEDHLFPGAEYSYSIEVEGKEGKLGYSWLGFYSGETPVAAEIISFISTPVQFEGGWETWEGTFVPPVGTRSMEWGPFASTDADPGDQMSFRNPYLSRPTFPLESDMDLFTNGDFNRGLPDLGPQASPHVGWLPVRNTMEMVYDEELGQEVAEITSTTGTQHFGPFQNWLEFELGEIYDFSITFKMEADHEVFIYADFYDEAGGESVTYALHEPFTASGEWETRTGSFTAPADPIYQFGGYWGLWQDPPGNDIGDTFRIARASVKKRPSALILS